ncbi:MAG: adenosine deaminase [Candidatus Zixiibacteriota bacterium]|nr:MAG: adenosine deaminase [candidate division Zixibacteria bacterium]
MSDNHKEYDSLQHNPEPTAIPSEELVRALPKVDLHCHLDGSMRVQTIWELARERKVEMPAASVEELTQFFQPSNAAPSLPAYLKRFEYTLAVLQDAEALQRACYELCADAAAEKVLYLEVRFSPILHTRKGMRLTHVMNAVLEGMGKAERELDIKTGVIVCGIRNIPPDVSLRLAELTVAYRHQGVVGFDLAGMEDQYPAREHTEAFYLIRKNNINCTVHAGEAYGPDSIKQALHNLNTHRIGHGVRLKEDGDLLNYVNDHRIPLELCLTSNVHTGAVKSLESHPLRFYYDYGLRVTLNTDNRLFSNTTVTQEYLTACRTFGLSEQDLKNIIIMGFKSSFMSYKDKVAFLDRVLKDLRKPQTPF